MINGGGQKTMMRKAGGKKGKVQKKGQTLVFYTEHIYIKTRIT